MTLDRYTMERGIDFIPAIDVDSSVTAMADVEKLRPKKYLRANLRRGDEIALINSGENFPVCT